MSSYSEKLKNPKWQKKRLEILERDNWTCQICSDSENELVVHHKNYEKGKEPWDYDNNDLISLCINCHEKEHGVLNSFHIKKGIEKNFDIIEKKTLKQEFIFGIPTGFNSLDSFLGGLKNAELIVIASRPSIGKTAFSLNIARNIAVDSNIPVVIFSLEMTQEQISRRMLCSEARIDSSQLKRGIFSSNNELKSLDNAANILSQAPIFIDSSYDLTLHTIERRIRNLKSDKNIGIAIIDYIQLFSTNKFELSEISRRLKIIAKENNIPIIALSQLDKKIDERGDKRPLLSDLYEHDIVNNADVIIFLYRDEVYNKSYDNHQKGKVEVIISKQRNGSIGTFYLEYYNNYTLFENIKSDEEPL